MASGFGPWAGPPVSTGYSYPVVPGYMVPGSNQRVGRGRMVGLGGGLLAVIVFVVNGNGHYVACYEVF
jgi:hypothetical protein